VQREEYLTVVLWFFLSQDKRPLTDMVDAMLSSKTTMDEKIADSQFKMFTDSASHTSKSVTQQIYVQCLQYPLQ